MKLVLLQKQSNQVGNKKVGGTHFKTSLLTNKHIVRENERRTPKQLAILTFGSIRVKAGVFETAHYTRML